MSKQIQGFLNIGISGIKNTKYLLCVFGVNSQIPKPLETSVVYPPILRSVGFSITQREDALLPGGEGAGKEEYIEDGGDSYTNSSAGCRTSARHERERSHGLEAQGRGQGKRGQFSQAVTGVSGDRDSLTRVLQMNGQSAF